MEAEFGYYLDDLKEDEDEWKWLLKNI
jgi:hypothetical protein